MAITVPRGVSLVSTSSLSAGDGRVSGIDAMLPSPERLERTRLRVNTSDADPAACPVTCPVACDSRSLRKRPVAVYEPDFDARGSSETSTGMAATSSGSADSRMGEGDIPTGKSSLQASPPSIASQPMASQSSISTPSQPIASQPTKFARSVSTPSIDMARVLGMCGSRMEAEPTHTQECGALLKFTLAYSEDWLDVFDDTLDRMVKQAEDNGVSAEQILTADFHITDAMGCSILELSQAHAAQFPLRIRLGGSEPEALAAFCRGAVLDDKQLHDTFVKNLMRKPFRLGGPVSLSRLEELYDALDIHAYIGSEEVLLVPTVARHPREVRGG